MPKKRGSHRRPPQNASQMHHSNRWWAVGFLLAALIGGVIGYVSLLGDQFPSQGANFFVTPVGARLLGVGSGAGVGLLLIGLPFELISDRSISIGPSRRVLFWWGAGMLTVGLVGAILGFFLFPGTLPIPLRVLFGAFIGLFGLGVLLSILTDPKAALSELDLTGCLEGCCSFHFVFFMIFVGTVSGFLLWHSLLLEVLTGGVALITVILVAGRVLTRRKEEGSHGAKTPASESLSAQSA
jgi:hypothetical protein